MAELDKITRVLLMYTKLLEGRRIYKQSFCTDTGINRRTFDRDIEDIRIFFSESFMGYELVYDRQDESYHLKNYHQQTPLSAMEVSYLMTVVKSESVLRKDEYVQLIYNMIHTGIWNKQDILTKISEKDIKEYSRGIEKKKALLKMQWDLQQCIVERDIIRIMMPKRIQKVVAPLSLWIFHNELYLIGCGMKEDVEIIPVEKIQFFKMEQKKFSVELEEKFKESDWMELIQKNRRERIKDGTQEKKD